MHRRIRNKEIYLYCGPDFLKKLIQSENDFFEHFNFKIQDHILERRDLTSRMQEYAGK